MSLYTLPERRIHPTAILGSPPENRNWKPGDKNYGVLIWSNARINAYCTIDGGYEQATVIDNGAWLMAGVHIGHDAYIGRNTELAPHCSVGGHVHIGQNVKVGQGAIFKPRVRVGDGAVIGAGAVVTKDVPPHEVWAGVPAKKLKDAYETDEEMWHEQFERGRTR